MVIPVDTTYYKQLGSSRNYVYSYFKMFPNATRAQAEKDLDMCNRPLREALMDLEAWGYIEQIYVPTNHRWQKMIGVKILK